MDHRGGKFLGIFNKKKIYIGPDGRFYFGGSGPDAETYQNSPAMAITRANGKEFGLASHIATNIRFSLRTYKYFFRTLMHSNLHSVVRAIARADKDHLSGQRSFDFRAQTKLLENFNLTILEYIRVADFQSTLTISADRQQVIYNVPSFIPDRDLNFPIKTDFFRLFITATFVSSYFYDPVTNEYQPPEHLEYIFTKTQESDKYEKISMSPEINLVIDFAQDVDPTWGLIVCVGVEFFDVIGSTAFMKKEWGAMHVAKVG